MLRKDSGFASEAGASQTKPQGTSQKGNIPLEWPEMLTRIGVVRRNWIWIVAVVAAALLLAFLIRLLDVSNRPYVPPEFLKARASGSDAAQKIVDTSNAAIQNLQKIQEDESAGKYIAALNLVLNEINENNATRSDAVQLSEQLNVMASNLQAVRPEVAASMGLQAIISESQIVEELISYNNYTYELLNLLRTRLESGPSAVTISQINSVISEMNKGAASINDLNSKYESLMGQFDSLTN